MRMTDDEFEAIKARNQEDEDNDCLHYIEKGWLAQVHSDRAVLIAEVERLRRRQDDPKAEGDRKEVRICVAINDRGAWNSAGSCDTGSEAESDESLRDQALEFLDVEHEAGVEMTYFVTARIPIPKAGGEIKGSVE